MARVEKAVAGTQGRDDADITLGVLAAVDAQSNISQRTLSRELGVALGLANAYLKRCVRKGFVKIHQVPSRRYSYFLTPQGFAEKARLTGEYLTSSLQFFRRARMQLEVMMAECAARGDTRIALAGASELAEIATLTPHDHGVTIVGIFDPEHPDLRFCGLRVVKSIIDLGHVDAVIVTGMKDVKRLTHGLSDAVPEDRILIPELIHVSNIRRPGRWPRNTAERRLDGKSSG